MNLRLPLLSRRIVQIALLFVFTFLGSALRAQNGQFGYDLVASSGTFTSIANTEGSTSLSAVETDDALSGVINIGFPFYYYGQERTQLKVGSNGFVVFNTNFTWAAFSNNLTLSFPVIAPLWDDMSGDVGQSTYLTSGIAPNRIFTVEWLNWKWHKSATAAVISFQLKLYEGTNKIEFTYRQEAGALKIPSATIGITGGSNNLYALGDATSQPYLRPGGYNGISSKPATGQVYAFVARTEDFTTPTVQAANVTAVYEANNTVIRWTNGNGQYRAVFVKESKVSGDLILTNNTNYGAIPTVGNGDKWYCVYNGIGNEAYITPLVSTKNYKIQVVEYSGQGKLSKYNTSVSTNNPIVAGSKSSQTISFPAIPDTRWTSVTVPLNASTSSGLPVTYTSSDISMVYIMGNTAVIGGFVVGSVTITASQAGNESYSAATPVTQTLVIKKAYQVISFTISPNTVNINNGPITLNATSNGDFWLPITYTSSNPLVATIENNIATVVGPGVTSITAYKAGDNYYDAANPVTRSLTVSKINQTITFPLIESKKIGDPPFVLNASASSGLPVQYTSSDTSILTISGNIATIVGTGTVRITASQAGNENYSVAPNINYDFPINKLYQTISFTLSPNVVNIDNGPITLMATSSSGLPVSYISSNPLVATIDNNIVTIVGPGVTSIIASQAGNETYNVAIPTTRYLTVAKLNQTITFPELPALKVGESFQLNATASSGLSITYACNPSIAIIDNSTGTVTAVAGGTVAITAFQPGNGNYNSADSVSQMLTVSNKLQQSITFELESDTVNVNNGSIALTAIASSDLPVSYTSSNESVATVSDNVVTLMGPGFTEIVAFQEGDDTYDAAPPQTRLLVVLDGSGVQAESAVAAYPNEVAEELTVDVSLFSKEETTVTMYDLVGRKIDSKTGRGVFHFDVKDYKSGNYVLKATSGTRVVSRHIKKK